MPPLAIPQRRQEQLPARAQTEGWWFFITICTKNREHLFGDIAGGRMFQTVWGRIAEDCWKKITRASTDVFVVMPNHMHGILRISSADASAWDSLAMIVSSYKAEVTRQIRRNSSDVDIWFQGHYQHLIHSKEELQLLRQYIKENPSWWDGNWDDLEEEAVCSTGS